ncbi:ergothioneine biosynthesis protein 1 [Trichoderma asperellum]|uniref:4-dimethylallyltryptophan N-methyltransferase n=1 Tax=Trichoderma asperellum TaxID=101201 RepID=A0A6V8QQL4_TRIAP|nr:ergothioneine biosynthesis protein 1 [Trichoderma asperellum]
MIDLGVGDTRKVEHLLSSFEEAQLEATYLALDISKASLEHSVGYLLGKHSSANAKVTCAGLWGTFQDGMSYVKGVEGQRLFLSLGSVLCNDPWAEALNHLRYWAAALRPGDLLLVGMDAHLLPKDEDKIWKAYHSRDDLYRQFFLNGFNQVNKAVGEEWFQEEDWEFMAQLEEQPTTRHRFFFRAKRDVIIHKLNRTFKAGDELDWFDSHKYGEESVRLMCHKAGLSVINVMQAPGSEFRQYLLKAKEEQDQREDGDSAISGLA